MRLTLVRDYYTVTLEYIGKSIVLYSSAAFDVDPTQHNVKPHYFTSPAEAKGWMIKQAYAMLELGWEVEE